MSSSSVSNPQFYVIGAGLPRTGTTSLKVALEKLLAGNCGHMISFITNSLEKDEAIHDLLDKETATNESIKNYFMRNNLVAAVDVPFLFAYKQIMEVYPDAKVILTIREPSSWVTSVKETICKARYNSGFFANITQSLINFFNRSDSRFWSFCKRNEPFSGTLESVHDGTGVEYFSRWNEDVKNYVPHERLLIFNVKEGWEPLCKFLNLPIPDEPFPHVNDKNQFSLRQQKFERISYVVAFSVTVLPLFVGLVMFKYSGSLKSIFKM